MATENSNGANVMDDYGLTFAEEARYRSLCDQCEAGVAKFSNDQMSEALMLVETLRKRWAKLLSPSPATAATDRGAGTEGEK